MKTFSYRKTYVLFSSIICSAFAPDIHAGTTTNGQATELVSIIAATTNSDAVIAALPQIEVLWPHLPTSYFQCMRDAARALSSMQATNVSARKALGQVYDAVISRKIPSDFESAATCIDLKSETVMACFNSAEVRSDKARLVALAKLVGEIRSVRIKDYVNRGMAMPPDAERILVQARVMDPKFLTNSRTRKAFDEAIEAGQQARLMDIYQSKLRDVDSGLAFFLMNYSSQYFPASIPTNSEFVAKIALDAHLTAEEQKKL